jgi:hypothetical protein
VSRSDTAETALIAHDGSSGYLVVDENPSLGGRIRTVLSRIGTSLPNGVGSGVVLAGFFASVAFSILALMVAAGPSADFTRPPAEQEPQPETTPQ